MKPYIVIDTNVLISALMNANSPSALTVQKAFEFFQPIASADTWNEFEEVSGRYKFARFYTAESRLYFLATLAQSVHFFSVTLAVQACRDPKDDKFLALALAAGCELIVAGDKDLTDMHPYNNVQILQPRAFLNLLADE